MPRSKSTIETFLEWAQDTYPGVTSDIREPSAEMRFAELLRRVDFRAEDCGVVAGGVRPFDETWSKKAKWNYYMHIACHIRSSDMPKLKMWMAGHRGPRTPKPSDTIVDVIVSKKKEHGSYMVDDELMDALEPDFDGDTSTTRPDPKKPKNKKISDAQSRKKYPEWGSW